jgi:murein DD-endopeptidase MepM/ murein hydrolase activator NlpD
MNEKLKLWKRFRAVNFVLGCAALFVLNGCATRLTSSGHHGLLDNESSSSSADHAATSAQSPDELYAPKEGEKLELVGKWQWPLNNVKISSGYGHRGSKFHQGVDLHAPMHTPVFAASDGEVVYVGSKIRGFGRMVVIKHAGDLYSVYAHHSKNLVKVGEHVKRGEQIAFSGASGHAHGAHLHFEIRKGTRSYDPEVALNDNIRMYANRAVASEKRN